MGFSATPVLVSNPSDLKEVRIANSANNDYLLFGKVVHLFGNDRSGFVDEYKDGKRTGNQIRFAKRRILDYKTGEKVTLAFFEDQDPFLYHHCENLEEEDKVCLLVYPTTSGGRFYGCRKAKSVPSAEAIQSAKAGYAAAHSMLFRQLGLDNSQSAELLAATVVENSSHTWKTFANKAHMYLPASR